MTTWKEAYQLYKKEVKDARERHWPRNLNEMLLETGKDGNLQVKDISTGHYLQILDVRFFDDYIQINVKSYE